LFRASCDFQSPARQLSPVSFPPSRPDMSAARLKSRFLPTNHQNHQSLSSWLLLRCTNTTTQAVCVCVCVCVCGGLVNLLCYFIGWPIGHWMSNYQIL